MPEVIPSEVHLSGFTPWPEPLAESYRRAGYWAGESLGDVLSRLAREHGNRTALIDANGKLSYAELESRAGRLARALRAMGLRSRDRAIVQLPNGGAWYEICFALWKLGVIPVLAQPAHRAHEVCSFAEQTGARAYFISDVFERFDYRPLADVVRARTGLEFVVVDGNAGPHLTLRGLAAPSSCEVAPLARVGSGEVALLQLSGGSTGVPKLIPRTHDDYLYSVAQSVAVCGWSREVVYGVALPCAHNFPLSSPGALGALVVGGTAVLLPSSSPNVALPLIEKHQVNVVSLVPALARLWCAGSTLCPPSLKTIQVGGAKLDEEAARMLDAWCRGGLQQVFGMAEGLVNYTRDTDTPVLRLTTQGRPMSPADELLVVDDEDHALPQGRTGHLLTRGPYTVRGYYRAEEHNRRAFTKDGYYRTGDLVRQLPSGHLVVEGRAKDQINRGGEKISAEEVEAFLRNTGLVTDAALVGIPDLFLGEKSCAFVCGHNPNVRLEEVKEALRRFDIATYKLPDKLVWLSDLPKTPVGKINKVSLAKRFLDK